MSTEIEKHLGLPVVKYVPITEDECTALIRLSGPARQYIPLAFGTGGVAIDAQDSDARWAIEQLARIRGIDPTPTIEEKNA